MRLRLAPADMDVIPNGWQRCALPDFACIVMGQSPSSTTYNHNGDGLPFFQGKAEFGRLYPTINMYCSQPNKIAKQGATLLSVRAPVGPTNLAQHKCCIGRGLAALHPHGGIEPKFLLYLFRSKEPVISGKGTGSTFKAVTKAFVEGLEFNLPPMPEQRRIVAKIEELFSELDKGVESLKTARAKLNVYRQAVLKHAFEGKLTAQWREENKDRLETPEQLLARIKQERVARYEQQLKEWKAAVNVWEAEGKEGKKSPKPRKPKSPEFVVANPTCNPFWTQSLLDELAAESVLGKMLDREKNSGIARQYLGNLNLRWGKFDLKNLKTMKVEDSEIQRYSLARGDLVICEGGEPGRCAVWEGTDHTMIIQKALHRVRFTESYSPYFAYYFMTYAAVQACSHRILQVAPSSILQARDWGMYCSHFAPWRSKIRSCISWIKPLIYVMNWIAKSNAKSDGLILSVSQFSVEPSPVNLWSRTRTTNRRQFFWTESGPKERRR